MPVKMKNSNDWRKNTWFCLNYRVNFVINYLALAEILSIKEQTDGHVKYYIHYIDYNKRLDEWVSKDRLDLHRMQLPKKDIKTPLKNGSRPSSPDRDLVRLIFDLWWWNNF